MENESEDEQDFSDWFVVYGDQVAEEMGIKRGPDGAYSDKDVVRLEAECRERWRTGIFTDPSAA